MLFVRAFVVPSSAKVLVAEIAGASMFIYLSHYQVIFDRDQGVRREQAVGVADFVNYCRCHFDPDVCFV